MKPIKLIVSGGGTGGHIYPALAIASELKAQSPDSEVLFVGARGKMEMEKVPRAGFSIKGLWISGFQRRLTLGNLLFPLKVLVSLIQAYVIIKQFKPSVVVGTGGFASGPILQIAQWLKLPNLIQEQNSYPGITNRILSKKVDAICVAFEGMERYFPKPKIKITGNPIRAQLQELSSGKSAKSFFGLNSKKLVLAIIGGSLGAKVINELIAEQLPTFQKLDLQLLWQCGALYHEKYKSLESEHIIIRPFIYEMDQFYAAADFLISRAGAGSLSELCCIAKPLLLIPSPNVTANHQYHNAMALANKGGAVVVEEPHLESDFKNRLEQLVTDRDIQNEMKQALKGLAKPNATKEIIKEIKRLL